MFNVTGGEFFMILVVALVVLGPERLPVVARRLGELMGQLRDLSEGFKREVSQALDDPGEPIVKPMTRPQLTALEGGAFDTAAAPGAADGATAVSSEGVGPPTGEAPPSNEHGPHAGPTSEQRA